MLFRLKCKDAGSGMKFKLEAVSFFILWGKLYFFERRIDNMVGSDGSKNSETKSPPTLFKRQGCGVSCENPSPSTYTRKELHELIKKHYPHYLKGSAEEK
jgi:hypothetical protein